ncbi:hypothetical protein A2U01_0089104, partial [Trifolium medium]|nr:hypothetical protein [Trifolium medium]
SSPHPGRHGKLRCPPSSCRPGKLGRHNVRPLLPDFTAVRAPPCSLCGLRPPRVQRGDHKALGLCHPYRHLWSE